MILDYELSYRSVDVADAWDGTVVGISLIALGVSFADSVLTSNADPTPIALRETFSTTQRRACQRRFPSTRVRVLHVVHENDELETPMPALSMLTALMLLPVSAVAQNEEPAQLLEYMKDLKGTVCSADTIILKSAPGGKIRYTIVEPVSLQVLGGKLDEAGNAWAQVRNDNNKSQTGWVPLDKLSCI
jgi:hypothetical protein